MRRYLVVAHKTLGGAHLLEHLHHVREQDPNYRFHLLVPEHHPHDHVWTDGETQRVAQTRVDEMLDTMAAMGMGATGEAGDQNVVYAIGTVLRREGPEAFAGIVLSTLAKGISRWWRFDVPRRVAQAYPRTPLTHLVAGDALVN
jgi:hypothetical protein